GLAHRMTRSQWEHPEAVAEFDAAVRWYDEQEPEIGLALIDRARQARKNLDPWPNAAPPFAIADDGTVIRSKAIRGYPYRIVYTVEPDTILILAYAHERQEPGYWLRRLND
ncbi:MAG: type II toxin-antitoxin system RelE/ParE family toxin, partial [Brachybacterium sp.]|nr:type II toxin-antitoxin system RelE/ParE family toxin [Brachybacterium sp.]